MCARTFKVELIMVFVFIAASLIFFACVTKGLPDLKRQANSLIGQPAQEVERAWGPNHGFSRVSVRGAGVVRELWTYHFLKKDGQDILEKYISMSHDPKTGAISMGYEPYAPEVLKNYWVFDVYIEQGIVRKVELKNTEAR